MDQSKQRLIASKGGRTAHEKGTAHKWTVEEAREAGRKGGAASHRRAEQTSMPLVGAPSAGLHGSEMPPAG